MKDQSSSYVLAVESLHWCFWCWLRGNVVTCWCRSAVAIVGTVVIRDLAAAIVGFDIGFVVAY